VQRFSCSAQPGASSSAAEASSQDQRHKQRQQQQPFLQRAQRAALTIAQGIMTLGLLALLQVCASVAFSLHQVPPQDDMA
jgi:hypothetical protein